MVQVFGFFAAVGTISARPAVGKVPLSTFRALERKMNPATVAFGELSGDFCFG
jgi:hypothetical protein